MRAKVEGEGEQPGTIRTAETPDGQKQGERLQEIDPKDHFYRYVMLSTPIAVKDYSGEFRVHDDGKGSSTVSWSNTFQVTSGNEGEVAGMIREFLNAGVQSMKKKYS
jgi:hypothetical protein